MSVREAPPTPPVLPPEAEDARGGPGHRVRTERRALTRRERFLRVAAPRDRLLQLLLLAVILGVWEFVGQRSSNFTFSPPSSVIPAAGDMIESGQLQDAIGDSLFGLFIGFALAAVVGTAIGYAMGWWRLIGRTLDPFVAALYVVPIAALVPLIINWWGIGTASRIVVIFLFAVFEILLNAYAGIRNIDQSLVDVARAFGARRSDLVRRVALPASLPFVMVGMRIGASRALKGMVLAEMLFASTGLGGLIIDNAQAFRMDRVLVAVLVIAAIGIALTAAVRGVERYVLRWRG